MLCLGSKKRQHFGTRLVWVTTESILLTENLNPIAATTISTAFLPIYLFFGRPPADTDCQRFLRKKTPPTFVLLWSQTGNYIAATTIFADFSFLRDPIIPTAGCRFSSSQKRKNDLANPRCTLGVNLKPKRSDNKLKPRSPKNLFFWVFSTLGL